MTGIIVEANNMIWTLVVIAIGVVTFLPTRKPLNQSSGILKLLDPAFEEWSNRIMKLGILDNNWLTASKQNCLNALDYISGNCIYINHAENDPNTQSQIIDLSPFHFFCYILIRRFVEIICVYLTRWIFRGCLLAFISSSCVLLGIFLWKKLSLKKMENESPKVSKNLMMIIAILLASCIPFLAIVVPLLIELAGIRILEKEISWFYDDADEYMIEKVLYSKRSCSTFYDLYYFCCLRKTVFDLEASDIRTMSPNITLSEKICLQIQMVLINGVTLIAYCILYYGPVLVCYVFVRFFMRLFQYSAGSINLSTLRMRKKKRPLPFKELSFAERCNKKILEPGIRDPWRELSFTTSLEDNLTRSIKKKQDFQEQYLIESLNTDASLEGNLNKFIKEKNNFQEKCATESLNTDGETLPISVLHSEKLLNELPSEIQTTEHLEENNDTSQPPENRNYSYVRKALQQRPEVMEYIPAKRSASAPIMKEPVTTCNPENVNVKYIDAGTYVCFDSDDDDDDCESDFSSLD